MSPPETATAPTRAGRGGETNIHLGGEPKDHSIAAQQAAAAIDAAIVAALLDCRSVPEAARILDHVAQFPPPDPLLRWVIRLAALAVQENAVPDPTVCGELARRNDDIPPGVTPLSALFAVATDPPLVVNLPWYLARYRENVVRRRLQDAAVRLGDVVWRGDISELREVVSGEFRALRAAFDAAEVVDE